MPSRAPHACPDCGTLTQTTRCPPCTTIHDAPRRVYATKRWRILRRHVLATQPTCPGYPPPCGAPTLDVDHVRPLREGGDPYAPGNAQALCHACHARKTLADNVLT